MASLYLVRWPNPRLGDALTVMLLVVNSLTVVAAATNGLQGSLNHASIPRVACADGMDDSGFSRGLMARIASVC
jgi:hypothetical protein